MNTTIPTAATDFEASVQHASHCSRYIQRILGGDPELLPWLRENYAQPCSADEMSTWLDALPADDEGALSSALRIVRKRVMLKLLTRDLCGLAMKRLSSTDDTFSRISG